jgi:hypothetical protein
VPIEDIQWALAEYRAKKRVHRYKKVRDYYEGRHNMAFAQERFATVFGERFWEITDNLCPAIVDTVADRLTITGFSSSAVRRRTVAGQTVVADPLGSQAWAIWKRNRMRQRSNEVHRESLLTGDGYAIVWPDENGQAAIWPQVADEMVVEYSELRPGELVRAGRVWRQADGRTRVTIYFRDRIERYVSDRTRVPGTVAAKQMMLLPDGEVENPFGVPVFHFPNKRLFGYGVSELDDVIPLQDALNKSVCDMLVAMEFAAFRQRWATGLDVEVDEDGKAKAPPFRPGVDRIFAAEDKEVRFGEFAETNLEQFLKVQEDLRAEIARVSGTPLHYLFITRGDFPSGEAMKSAEARLTEKLEDRHDAHGPTWQRLMTFALTVESARLPQTFELRTSWADPAPRSDEERARTGLMKRQLGVSRRQVLKEQGYNDELIEEMIKEEPVQTVPVPDRIPAPEDDPTRSSSRARR